MRARVSLVSNVHAWMLCGGLSLFFIALEVLKAQRSSQWAGFLLRDVAGAGFALAAYLVALLVVFSIVRAVLQLVRMPEGAAEPFALLGAGLGIWGVLSVHREVTPTMDDGMVALALVACSLALAVGRGRWYSSRRFGAALLALGLAALSALVAAGEFWLFSPERAKQITLYFGLWSGVSALVLFLVLLKPFGPRVLIASALGLIALPPVAAGLRLHAGERGDGPPNLVFMVADTLRADYCSAYGGPVPTPHLAQLAERGTRFARSYSLAPWTLPSMTGLLSSQYPRSLTPGSGHPVWSLQMNQYEVDLREPSLPMRLQAAGYATGAVTANAFLPSIPGMMAGIETRASSHPILLREEGYFSVLPFLGALVEAWFPALAEIRPHNTTRDLDHYARAFIRRHRDRPFFLWVHYIDPHAPYDPPASLRRVPEGPWPFFHPYSGGEAWGLPILGKNFEVAPADRDYVKSLYEGEVAYIDEFAGRVMAALQDEGIADNTYFCFTSDHGEELWDHGQWGHGQALYEEQLRVPLIVAGPGIRAQVVNESVSSIHLVPTLAELMGVTAAGTWKGESLAPVLRGEVSAPPARPIFAQGTTNKTETPMHTVILGDYKLIRIAGSESVQLYDLSVDPGERQDLSASQPDRVKELSALLDAWLASFPSFFDVEGQEFNEELEQGLEGMGYL